MISLFIRFFPLLFATIALLIAWMWWTIGDPPAWSIIAERETVTIVNADIVIEPVGNGTLRYVPVVEVVSNASRSTAHQVNGLMPGFSSGTERQAERALASYAVGDTIRVRRIEDRLYANRTEVLDVIISTIATLAGLLGLGVGLMLNWPRRR